MAGFGPMSGGNQSALNVSAATVIATTASPGPKRVLVSVSVTVAGAAGAIYDVATTGAAAASNLIAVIPAVVGTYTFNWPCALGIVFIPGAAQIASISYS